jgi:hypothetical protein
MIITTSQIFIALFAWAFATAIFCYVVFRFGYNLGWDERHKSMILPRNVTAALNKRLDDDERHERHSAMHPGKMF